MNTEYRKDLKSKLTEKRDKLSANSLQTYVSLLASLSKKLNDVDTVTKLIGSKKKILKEVAKMKSVQSQKTLLSALYILTEDIDYKDKMMVFIRETNAKYKEQKVSLKLKESYITPDKIKQVYDNMKVRVTKVPSVENYVDYLIVGLMSGIFIAPRRLEYATVKIKDYDAKADNFLDIKKKTIGFNVYKTFKTYGFQMIEIPKEIIPILKKFLKLNETDYLLIKNNGKPMSSSELSKRVGKIFNDEKIGVDVLRSIYVSNLYKDVPNLTKLEKVASEMGHSVGAAMTYYKKNDVDK